MNGPVHLYYPPKIFDPTTITSNTNHDDLGNHALTTTCFIPATPSTPSLPSLRPSLLRLPPSLLSLCPSLLRSSTSLLRLAAPSTRRLPRLHKTAGTSARLVRGVFCSSAWVSGLWRLHHQRVDSRTRSCCQEEEDDTDKRIPLPPRRHWTYTLRLRRTWTTIALVGDGCWWCGSIRFLAHFVGERDLQAF